MAGVSTHVLDTERGRPAAGVKIDMHVLGPEGWRLVKSVATNADGRTDQPMVAPADARIGEYMLEFHAEEYFRSSGRAASADPAFIDTVLVRFSIFDVAQHYHVPLLCTPASASTYRGS